MKKGSVMHGSALNVSLAKKLEQPVVNNRVKPRIEVCEVRRSSSFAIG